jgi:hypothetical protein
MEATEMYSVRTLLLDAPPNLSYIDAHPAYTDPDPCDVWLFTDDEAKSSYAHKGELDKLEHDIKTYVMFKNRWSPDELDFIREIGCLTQLRVIAPGSAFGHISPHPTIYRAIEEGVIRINGRNIYFNSGDEIVFEPWLVRLTRPGLIGPLRIGSLNKSEDYYLSAEALPQFKELSESDFAVLHRILYLPKENKI